jgi:hypothetical protein
MEMEANASFVDDGNCSRRISDLTTPKGEGE